ncbi:survival motor neuron-like protein 1 [Colletotrichum musicola]|uniref:Survival motor neuron-like protein 1 n=1 Tax=Colletotrichum musicola TaxID=2175873 RepID=A0A8H6NRM5_9PEZI|nr:survival motor neuron-like protein 1 [Colletotrichum musicola]
MAGNNVEMTHAEMWDDSALIESWNEALAEYKKYHSIHAKGGRLEDLDLQEKSEPQTRKTVDSETEAGDRPEIAGDVDEASKTKGADGSTDVHSEEGVPIAKAIPGHGGSVAGPATMGPQSLLGSVQDEGLKRLLMSWYYAGYYTGLYEGQQQERQQQQTQ